MLGQKTRGLVTRCVLFVFLGLSEAFIILTTANASEWTSDNLGEVTEAAIIASHDASMHSFQLMQLANALIKAGDKIRARDVVLKASLSLRETDYASVRADVVEKLALLGDVSSAESVIAKETTQLSKLILLGKLGVGHANAGDLDGAQRVAKTVASLSESSGTSNPLVSEASTRAIAGIGASLGAKGASQRALEVLGPLQNGLEKVRALSRTVAALCEKSDRKASEKAINQLSDAARLAVEVTSKPYEKLNIVAEAGDAIASCLGSAQTQTFVTDTLGQDLRDRTLRLIVDRLAERGELALGLSLLPGGDPEDVESLLLTAKLLLKLGDQSLATRAALQAAHKALQGPPAALRERPGGYFDYIGQLGQISGILADLGAYDEAIAVVQLIDVNNRAQFYVRTIDAAIRRRDAAGVAKVLPIAIGVFGKGTSPIRTIQIKLLSNLTRSLAVAGYRDEALKTLQELHDLLGASPSPDEIRQKDQLSIVMQADGGDVQGALYAADQAGLMIAKPSDAQVSMLAAMSSKPQSTAAEFDEAKRRAMERLSSVSGPKSEALSAIIVHLARKGIVASALQVFTILDAEQAEAVKGVHDTAAGALADAQEKQGDLRGSFATALRIRQTTVRWPILLKLAAVQPNR